MTQHPWDNCTYIYLPWLQQPSIKNQPDSWIGIHIRIQSSLLDSASWVKKWHFWGEISPLEGAHLEQLLKKKNIGGECPAFFDTSLRLCRDFKKSKHLKDGEMVTWYVNIMFTSNNSIFKIKIKKKLIYYQGFGAFRIWENLPNIAWTLPFSETTNGSGLLKIDGVQDAIMAGRIMFRQAPSSTCASKPGGLQYPTCLRYYRLRNRTPCKDKVCFSTGKGCHCPNRIRPQSQHSSVVCGVFCWPWPWWVFFSKHTDNTTTR